MRIFSALGTAIVSLCLCVGCDSNTPADGNSADIADGVDHDAMDHDAMPMDAMDHDAMAMDATMEMDGLNGMSMVPPVIELPASAGPFEVPKAADRDPAAHVVEVDLEAREADIVLAPASAAQGDTAAPGKPATHMWTYNGQFPGPEIDAQVGDTVRVHFTNSLPEATTIHWHGIRVPATMDGSEMVQAPVEPGASFTYEFVVPDAGTFWYHPHLRSSEQVERGLYGAVVVRANNEPATTSDRVVMLDDVLVGDDFQLSNFSVDQAMVGRQGNVILVNGHAHPIAPVEPGGLHRFRFVNASNARYFRLSLPGKTLTQIGTDGGLLEAPRDHESLLLVPGERADIVVATSHTSSGTLTWKSLPYERGHGTGTAPDATLFDLHFAGAMIHVAPTLTAKLGTVAALPEATVTRTLVLAESDMMGGHAGHGGAAAAPVFSINGKVYPAGEMFMGTLGAVEAWTVDNTSPMDHPFHLHGFRFQVEGDKAWRDTINVPALTKTTFRVQLEDHVGSWMFHCHILEHAEHGMMGHLMVEAR